MKKLVFAAVFFLFSFNVYAQKFDLQKEIGIKNNLNYSIFIKSLDTKGIIYEIDTVNKNSKQTMLRIVNYEILGIEPLFTEFHFTNFKLDSITFQMQLIPKLDKLHHILLENASKVFNCDPESELYNKCENLYLGKIQVYYQYHTHDPQGYNKVKIVFY